VWILSYNGWVSLQLGCIPENCFVVGRPGGSFARLTQSRRTSNSRLCKTDTSRSCALIETLYTVDAIAPHIHVLTRDIPHILCITAHPVHKKNPGAGPGLEMVYRIRHRSVGTACHEKRHTGTVNLHMKHTPCRLKRCKRIVGYL